MVATIVLVMWAAVQIWRSYQITESKDRPASAKPR
jgi:hypothetical protein